MTLTFKTVAGEERRRQLDLWFPTEAEEGPLNYRGQKGTAAKNAAVAPGKHPVLLFSHGYLGVSDQSIFLTEACARAGYIVASMNHGDALVNIFQKKQDPPKFAEFAKWTDAKYRDRQEDIVALLDQLLAWDQAADSPFFGHVDPQHIGGMGHSLGGYTMLGLAGGWESWREPRIKAAVLLSPFAQPYDVNGQLDKVTIPVMIQGGTLDWGISPFLPPVYKKLPGAKSYLVLKNETHFGWTNLISLGKTTTEAVADGNAELIVRYTIAYFDQHLLEKDRAEVLKAKEPRLEIWKYEVGQVSSRK
jgi:predicted dienelactone hydrolase